MSRWRQAKEHRHIYVIGAADRDLARDLPVKIGVANSPEERCVSLQTGSPIQLEIYGSWLVPESVSVNARIIEARCHSQFADKHSHGEWFFVSLCDVMYFIKQLGYLLMPRDRMVTKFHPFEYTPRRGVGTIGNNSVRGVLDTPPPGGGEVGADCIDVICDAVPSVAGDVAPPRPAVRRLPKRRAGSPVDVDVARLVAGMHRDCPAIDAI